MKPGELNPLCACGCGLEVVLPWNTWVQGHSARTWLKFEDIERIQQERKRGTSIKNVSLMFNVGTVTVTRIMWGMTDSHWRYVMSPNGLAIPNPGEHAVIRRGQLDSQKRKWEAQKDLRVAKTALREMRAYLKRMEGATGTECQR